MSACVYHILKLHGCFITNYVIKGRMKGTHLTAVAARCEQRCEWMQTCKVAVRSEVTWKQAGTL